MPGQEIRTLLNQQLEAGENEIIFDAGELPSGIYFYKIQSGGFTQSRKLILIK